MPGHIKKIAVILLVACAAFLFFDPLENEMVRQRNAPLRLYPRLWLYLGCSPSTEKPCLALKGDRGAMSQIRSIFRKKDIKKIEKLDRLYDFSRFRGHSGKNILHLAVYVDNSDILRKWVDKYRHLLNEVNARGFTPLYRAVQVNAPHSVSTLLAEGADISVRTHRAKINVVESCQTILSEHGKWEACEVLQKHYSGK